MEFKNTILFIIISLYLNLDMKKCILFKCLLASILSMFFLSLPGQITIELGNGEETNDFGDQGDLPCIYATGFPSVKHQMLVRGQELIDEGATAGEFVSIAFNVAFASNFEDMDDFTIRIGETNLSELSDDFEGGLVEVFGPVDYTATDSWNIHEFDSPFEWDGTSNLIIETCFQGFGSDFNSIMLRSETGFNATNAVTATGGGNNACNDNSGNLFSTRQDMRLVLIPSVAPEADFTASATNTCNGIVNFLDLSDFNPTSWMWDFGDMNTSDEQNPIHTYTSNGLYTVTLIVSNDFGSDTITFTDYIEVDLSTNLPISASCLPVTTNGTLGFGITNVTFNTIDNSSQDSSVGFEDYSCFSTTLSEGGTYSLEINAVGPANNFVKAWIDYNNNGIFQETESILSEQFNGIQSTDISIPAGVVLDTPLRMRVAADFFQNGIPDPCGPYASGQAEDYTVIIEENSVPPIAAFSFDPSFSCDGTIQFIDNSQNLPSSWLWDFGDTETSFLQNPEHTYLASGTYDVTLTVINSVGSDMITISSAVTVDLDQTITAANCTPGVSGFCCEYGITNFSFNDINLSSDDASEGYQDNSCQFVTEVFENEAISYSISTGGSNPHDTKIWVDFNNDGAFGNDEIIVEHFNELNHTGNFTFNGSPIFDTTLRMRVSSDVVGAILDACSNQTFGQTEDYAIIIQEALMPPIPDFQGFPLYSCDGEVEFEDLSTNNPSTWLWDFGDMNTSDEQNPVHTYANDGVYTVTLTVSNNDGTDSIEISSYIVVDSSLPCNIESLTPSTAQESQECQGMLLDSGEFFDYDINSNESFTINVSDIPGPHIVQLNFLEFSFSFPDILSVYDGPNTSSPLIGTYTGNNLPNGGTIVSSDGTITIAESTNEINQNDGFVLTWDCISVGIEELLETDILIQPNPSNGNFRIASPDVNWDKPQIRVVDLTGRLVYLENINNVSSLLIDIDLTDFSKGMYNLSISDKELIATKKIIIH